MKPSLEIHEASIVLVGRFDPLLITPGWLAHHEIVDVQDARTAEVAISHPEVSQFGFDWCKIFVDANRFQILTSQSPFIRISDFAVKVLSDLIPGIPVWAVGINNSRHYRVDPDQLNLFGERLAPREMWGAWGANAINEGVDRSSGLLSTSLRQGTNLPDRKDGHVDVRIEPSSQIKGGLYVHVNDHFTFGTKDNINDSSEAVALLGEHFERSQIRAEEISSGIITSLQS